MVVSVKDIYTQFNKKELLACADELGIVGETAQASAKLLSDVILKDLEENGIPENLEDISDSLFELLVAAEYIDEEGNLLDSTEEEEKSIVPVVVVEDIPDWVCFGYAEPRDPACNKCRLYDACWVRRIDKRPQCFGKMYAVDAQECRECGESYYCKLEKE